MGRTVFRPLDGILLLDKPAGLSSNQALQRVRHLYRAEKGGHTGALDPLATGLLPLCFGEATKIAGLLLGGRKAYEAEVALGATTDTDDADGQVLRTRAVFDDPNQAFWVVQIGVADDAAGALSLMQMARQTGRVAHHGVVAGGHFEHLPAGLLAHPLARRCNGGQGGRGAVDKGARRGGHAEGDTRRGRARSASMPGSRRSRHRRRSWCPARPENAPGGRARSTQTRRAM